MSYQPVVPFGGYAGWIVLQRTKETQQEAFNTSQQMQREVDYFRDNIGKVQTVDQLMSDYRLLKVALGAFGLHEDINNKYFIQKVLEEGTLDDESLANKLSDKSYYKLSEAFGFGNFDTPNTVLSDFADEIITSYQSRQFEIAIGEQNEDMRLALHLETALTEIAQKDTTENGRWYSVMGNEAVRTVFETALGLPSSLSALDLDQQLTNFREKADRYFGDPEVAQFANPQKREELIKLYLIRSELTSGTLGNSAASRALALLRG
ncbi:DUF1217 domain-containing protein [Celeribacter indicus]|uniref:Flagellar protein n=1 Tax=Celeribacter indicus TaxID=1208324 RepID=A0A0B5DVL8_9RHOB|nr:DUF1217 domain-containing protein [Celeribacter indicus]AJE44806.1 hypothetical protein P73_0091 [Celeribacter indicus]SDX24584.1 Protein of unknown function [Celeribacter indicus]